MTPCWPDPPIVLPTLADVLLLVPGLYKQCYVLGASSYLSLVPLHITLPGPHRVKVRLLWHDIMPVLIPSVKKGILCVVLALHQKPASTAPIMIMV